MDRGLIAGASLGSRHHEAVIPMGERRRGIVRKQTGVVKESERLNGLPGRKVGRSGGAPGAG
jgi:hypothetical protein